MGQTQILFELLFGKKKQTTSNDIMGVGLNKKNENTLGFVLMLLTVFLISPHQI